MLDKLVIKDVKTGKPSYTLTVFLLGSLLINLKLLLSGMQFTETFKFETFSGLDYAAAMGSIGMVYTLRKNSTIKQDSQNKDSQ